MVGKSPPQIEAIDVTQQPHALPAESALDAAGARSLILPLYEGRLLRTGEPFAEHADGTAAIVQSIRGAPDLLAAAYLFGAHEVLRNADEWIRTRAGASVAVLVADLRQLMLLSDSIRTHWNEAAGGQGRREPQAEALRRMLLAMVNDPRVVVLRLASRLQTMRYLAREPATAMLAATVAVARETSALLAPLANRLGIWQLKWELEDLALQLLEPRIYEQIAGQLEQSRAQRERTAEEASQRLRELLGGAGIDAEISGRPKHIASIHQKMVAKALRFEQVHDLLALRVIVDEVAACYEALSAVHSAWPPIEREYDDYIARPKPNGYQSLHTVVRPPDGPFIEIQIRTRQMHQDAELGIAAHWRYKEGRRDAAASYDERIAWLRRLFDWSQDAEAAALASQPQAEAVAERVYALTPQGRVIELPPGATPIDFAYHVHTELGHRCRGARVDGALVALNTRLRTGQTVEIIAARSGGPSRDWLNPELGFVSSARTRTKVRQWFNAIEHEQTVAAGREAVTRELQRLGRTAVNLEDLAGRLGFASIDELCVAIAREELGPRSIEQALSGTEQPAPEESVVAPQRAQRPTLPAHGRVLVVGVDSLMTNLAQCCRPIPPDEIVGFVTRGRGVSVHRASCVNARALAKRNPERVIEVGWGAGGEGYPTEVFVLAQDRPGLLRDISEVFAREKLNVLGVNTLSQNGEARMQFTVQVPDAAIARRALAQITEIKGVIVARRR
ncbi:MAG: bifunctional (p)ppGpp synthetase/guanosine-3',5'-bis(diphosphate) 3'-pyrophosphohydrolase [Burkholderiaceae bacterium]|nr:bifunctional (p)ppGpp synthetase/guanosine-3',5'-bis(diphosphate) 3'-pyrophosphohydrolase [Burkholderiaceae bacterium]